MGMTAFDLHAAVREFHDRFGCVNGDAPGFRQSELRIKLIAEEFKEFRDAVEALDIIEAADALGDLLYVVMGSFLAFGIDPNPVLAEIHRSNMTKAGGGKRADGKIQKGPDYSPPDLVSVIRAQVEAAMERASLADLPASDRGSGGHGSTGL